MAGVLDTVNQRTQLVGQNRLELLLFRLHGRQQFSINVFKVREVIQCPRLTALPHSHPVVRGVAHIRGNTIPVMDLGMAIGSPPVEDPTKCFMIITEYNRTIQGFLVGGVERIVNVNWGEIHPPPKGTGRNNYLTAVTEIDNQLVEIIDVEKVLDEVSPRSVQISSDINIEVQQHLPQHILVVDDSSVARKQICRTLAQVDLETTTANNGREALELLKSWADDGMDIHKQLLLVISDIEMPEMDGYTLTTEIKSDPRLKDLHIILHTSLSGVFNNAMVEKVGADQFIAKFQPDELAGAVMKYADSKKIMEQSR
ncbi:chemotaxis protein CheV [Pelagibaculum spongiae]|uniref:Chemotaxis protein CheW n=1 Tax=Pelagibaculum spongiae TaxID=2080658 RepID=A0A2V1GR17_9GAMM|nr:chemotaxis protein CheV [Pelagibaculum spongiae]PVZ66749.1 chemotaxis protein CheW [Pelagibaculum spongiae]